MTSTVLCSHTSSLRDSWWYLEQDTDGSLHIRYENEDNPDDKWRKPINEFLVSSNNRARRELMDRISRLFEER